MDVEKKQLYGHGKRVLYIVTILFLILSCLEKVLADANGWMSVNGCSVANDSVVLPTTVFTFAFGNNVVNASVRDYNSTKFSLETVEGSSVGIFVDMADDQIEPDLRWYITVIPEAELAPGSYCLTAHAGICAKSGKVTESDFIVNFTVEGDEVQEPGQEPELTPDPVPGQDTGTGPEVDPDPAPDLDPGAAPTESPVLSPLPEDPENGTNEWEQDPSLLPGTEGGNGGGSGASDENGMGEGQDSGGVPENHASGTLDSQQPRPSEPNTQPVQTPAARKEETGRKIARKDTHVMEEAQAEDGRLMDSQSRPDGSAVHFAVMKLKLGEAGRLPLAYQPEIYGKGVKERLDESAHQGSGGGAILTALILALVTGMITRTVSFWKDIA